MSEFGYVNVRGDALNAEFVATVAAELGQELPVRVNTLSNERHRVYWLGPDEWLIVTSADNTKELLARLRDALAAQHAAITDVSGGNVLFRTSGETAREILAKGSTLDFHPDVFPPGRCAQSGLAKANVLIGHIDGEPTYEIIVRRSFSEYVSRWLKAAGAEYCEKVSGSEVYS